MRIWFGFGRRPLEGFRLRRTEGIWSGAYVREALKDEWPFETRQVPSEIDLAKLWRKLVSAGILTLPDSTTLPGEKTILDGGSCVIELNDGDHYRTYAYHSPHVQPWPEAQKMMQIGDILNALYQPILEDRYKPESATWPKTREEAVDRVLAEMSAQDKETMRNTPYDELIRYHFGLGLWIRNNFGLWRGNYALLKDCGASVPDDASMVIIKATWRRLQPPFPVRIWRLINANWTSRVAATLVALLVFIVARGFRRRRRPPPAPAAV